MKRVCLVKSEICDVYTRIFRTRQEPQKFIKFSDSSGIFFSNSRRFIGKVFCVILRSLTGTPRDTCTRGAADHQILDVSYNIYKSKHLGRGAFFVLFSPFREPAPLTLNSPFTVFEKRGFQKPEQWWIFILYIKNTYRLQIYF